jgi:beta-glucuronidase
MIDLNPFRILLCLLAVNAGVMSHAEPVIGAVPNRQHWSLNGKWHYVIDQYEGGSFGFSPVWKDAKPRDRSDRVEYDFDASPTLTVPGDWNSQRSELFYFEGTIWYRRAFQVPAEAKGKRLFVCFDGANYSTRAYLNARELGRHEGGFTPFNFEITDKLGSGTNTLIVGVSNTRWGDGIPGKTTDWWNYGGITRDVRLVAVPGTFIENFQLQLAKGSANHATGWVQVAGVELPAKVEVHIEELGVRKSFDVDKTGRVALSLDLDHLQRWSPESPKLYKVQVRAGEDLVSERIGFRTLDTRGQDILLNGKPVFLRGVCAHEEKPELSGRAWSRKDAEKLLGYARKMNCNFVRLAHYPHNENIIRLADEWGIMLWCEQPLYWGIDWKSQGVLGKAKRMFDEQIARDGNRASVIIWSICNETGISDARNRFLAEVAAHVRSRDGTRLLSAALKPDNDHTSDKDPVLYFSDPLGQHLDVVAFNEYVGWYNGLPDRCKEKSFQVSYDKPLIVSEFGGDALQGRHGEREERWTEEYQEWLYQETIPMLEKIPQLRGTAPWVLTDFRSPLRMLPGVQDGYNRKGLVSSRGKTKKAFHVMQEWYATKARAEKQ